MNTFPRVGRLSILALALTITTVGCDRSGPSSSPEQAQARMVDQGKVASAVAPHGFEGPHRDQELTASPLSTGEALSLKQGTEESRILIQAFDGARICVSAIYPSLERLIAFTAMNQCSQEQDNAGHSLLSTKDGKNLGNMRRPRAASEKAGWMWAQRFEASPREAPVFISLREGEEVALEDGRRYSVFMHDESPDIWLFDQNGGLYDRFQSPPSEVESLKHISGGTPVQADYVAGRDGLIWSAGGNACLFQLLEHGQEARCFEPGLSLRDYDAQWQNPGQWLSLKEHQNPGNWSYIDMESGERHHPLPSECVKPRDLTSQAGLQSDLPRALFWCEETGGDPPRVYLWAPNRRWLLPGGKMWQPAALPARSENEDVREVRSRPSGISVANHNRFISMNHYTGRREIRRYLLDIGHGRFYDVDDRWERLSSLLHLANSELMLLDQKAPQFRSLGQVACTGELVVTLDTAEVQAVVCTGGTRALPAASDRCEGDSSAARAVEFALIYDLEKGTQHRVDAIPIAHTLSQIILSNARFVDSRSMPCAATELSAIER